MTTDYADALAEHLAAIAVEFVSRVRDHNPASNEIWLRHRLPDPQQWLQFAFVLAAAIPDDRSWAALTAWAMAPRPDAPEEDPEEAALDAPAGPVRELKPCGTVAAAKRHRYRSEPLDDACRDAIRAYDRDRVRNRREAA